MSDLVVVAGGVVTAIGLVYDYLTDGVGGK